MLPKIAVDVLAGDVFPVQQQERGILQHMLAVHPAYLQVVQVITRCDKDILYFPQRAEFDIFCIFGLPINPISSLSSSNNFKVWLVEWQAMEILICGYCLMNSFR